VLRRNRDVSLPQFCPGVSNEAVVRKIVIAGVDQGRLLGGVAS
jgi:hypothetical protein